MKAKEINHINEAVLVLRHFIDLSARLLPFLYELEAKRNPTILEKNDKKKIIDVYANYTFDTETSKILINSNILDLIRDSFHGIIYQKSVHKPKHLYAFLKEHDRLQNAWEQIESN
jgi:hypothetical protein